MCKYAQCKIFWGWLLRIPPPSRSNLESVMCSSNTPPLCRCRARTGNRPPTCHEITQMVGAMQAMRVACAHHGKFYVRKYLHSPGSHLGLLLGCPFSAHVFPEKISTICIYVCVQFVFFSFYLRFLYCWLLHLPAVYLQFYMMMNQATIDMIFYSCVLGGGGGRLTLCGLFLVSNQLEMDGSLSPSLWALQIHIHKSYCVKWPI